MHKLFFITLLMAMLSLSSLSCAGAAGMSNKIELQRDKPVALDSRIKTYIYSENEVFRLTVHYGYQTSIEFADGEEIQTISAGNNYAWQIVPVGRRLFLKPLEENVSTNMTILTNKRAYHFDVESRMAGGAIEDELVYVVRFFFPDGDFDAQQQPKLPMPLVEHKNQTVLPPAQSFNFHYTYSGPQNIAPLKIFDDGVNTFFKFVDDGRELPVFTIIQGQKWVELTPRRRGEYIVLNVVASQLTLTFSNGKEIMVFNEQSSKDKR
jgi:type IV secretion system protein VirB9